jgi:type VI protein secretion system component Hcp
VANADSDGYPHTVVNTAHEARRPNENEQGNDMKKILGFLLLLLVGLPAMAANTNYLKIDTIEGESIAKGFEKQIVIKDWSWGVTNTGGFPSFNDFAWTQDIDKSVVALFLGAANDTVFRTATLSVLNPSVGTFFQMTFTNVHVTNLAMSGNTAIAADGAFNYESVTMLYRPQDAKGGLGPAIQGTFNISQAGVLSVIGDPGVIQGLFLSGGAVSLQSIPVSNVPEPLVWGMLLAGLSMLAGVFGKRIVERVDAANATRGALA